MFVHEIICGPYRTYRQSAAVVIPKKPGLYLITGDNQVNPELGSNGVGKSSLFDALCFVLYNKSLKGLRGDSQAGEDAVYAKVVTDLGVIERTRKPNKLTFNGQVITDEVLLSKIGLSFFGFGVSVVMGQGQPLFLDAPKTKRLEILSEALGLQRFEAYRDRADRYARTQAEALAALQLEHARLNGRIVQLERLQQQYHVWRMNKAATLRQTRRQLATARREGITSRQVYQEGQRKAARIADALATCFAQLQRCDRDDSVEPLRQTITDCTVAISQQETVQRRMREQIEYYRNNTLCALCGQSIDRQHALKQVSELTKALQNIQVLLAQDKQRRAEVEKELNRKLELRKQIASKIVELNNEKGQLHVYTHTDYALRQTEDRITSLQAELQTKRREVFNTEGVDDLAVCKSKQVELDQRVNKISRQQTNAQFWVKHFRKIKEWYLAQALDMFKVDIESALSNMGFIEASVYFDPQSLDFTVHLNGQVVEVDQVSGGEAQRIKLAAQSALISTLHYYSSQSAWNIEVWDEAFSYLSNKGITQIIDGLRQRAVSQSKVIFVIDHHITDLGCFDGVFNVIKDKGGSCVAWCRSYSESSGIGML